MTTISEMITDAELAPGAPPGSPEWQRRCTASKLAPILGLSAWTSRYEIWHRMAGHLPPQEPTYAMLRGTHFEQGVLALWHELNPGWQIESTDTWRSTKYPWLYATPDSLALDPDGQPWCLEAKTCSTWNGWGPDGSTIVPPDYDCQTVVQAAVLGLPVLIIAVGPGFEMRTYERRPHPWQTAAMLDEARAFLDTLPGGPHEQEPQPGLADEQTLLDVTPIYRGWKRALDPDDEAAAALAAAAVAADDAAATLAAARMAAAERLQEAEALQWRGVALISRRTDGALNLARPSTLRKVIDQ